MSGISVEVLVLTAAAVSAATVGSAEDAKDADAVDTEDEADIVDTEDSFCTTRRSSQIEFIGAGTVVNNCCIAGRAFSVPPPPKPEVYVCIICVYVCNAYCIGACMSMYVKVCLYICVLCVCAYVCVMHIYLCVPTCVCRGPRSGFESF